MSSTEQHESHEHDGGHELEALNTKILFQLTFGLSALVLVACILVAQWFYKQNAAIQIERASQDGSYILRSELEKKAEMELRAIRPIIQEMVRRPELLKAQPAPEGWVHPDDVGKAAANVDNAEPGTDAGAVE